MEGLCLTILWLVSLGAGLRYAGYGENPPLRWHPAAQLVDFLFSRRTPVRGLACAFFLLTLPLMARLAPGYWWLVPLILWLLLAVPLPFLAADTIRRDTSLRSVCYTVINPVSPIGSAFERSIADGLQVETRPQIAFYIPGQEWMRIPLASTETQTFFSRFHRGSGLYVCPATNDTLQLIESLDLMRFMVNPENNVALNAFAKGLQALAEQSRPGAMPAAPAAPVSPGGTTAARPSQPSFPAVVPPPSEDYESLLSGKRTPDGDADGHNRRMDAEEPPPNDEPEHYEEEFTHGSIPREDDFPPAGEAPLRPQVMPDPNPIPHAATPIINAATKGKSKRKRLGAPPIRADEMTNLRGGEQELFIDTGDTGNGD